MIRSTNCLLSISVSSDSNSAVSSFIWTSIPNTPIFIGRQVPAATAWTCTPVHTLPLRFFNSVTLEPSVGLRETVWVVDEYDNQAGSQDRTQDRSLFDFNVDLSTEFFTTWDTAIRSVDRIKHTVRPQIVYSYIPHTDQEHFPNFDPVDRIARRNLLTYSLTNFFITRSIADPDTDPRVGANSSSKARSRHLPVSLPVPTGTKL